MSQKINLAEKLSQISEHWSPRIIANVDNYDVKIAKIKGDFVFHNHADEDEMFIVLKGRFRMDYEDRQEWIETGEMVVVPKGVEHKPFADSECEILMIERQGLINTGETDDERRVDNPKRI